eukprot:COSAG05_NODE_18437_length_308_cov_1.196172_1_plen_38_part_10
MKGKRGAGVSHLPSLIRRQAVHHEGTTGRDRDGADDGA